MMVRKFLTARIQSFTAAWGQQGWAKLAPYTPARDVRRRHLWRSCGVGLRTLRLRSNSRSVPTS